MLILCHGTFSVLHVGHMWHFKAARAMGSMLIVSITSDAYVQKSYPLPFSEEQRAAFIRELRCVNDVYICREATGATAIRHYRPQIYVKGIDYEARGICLPELEACKAVGAQIQYTRTMKYGAGDLVRLL